MRRAALLFVALLSAVPAAANSPAPLVVERTITLPHTGGRIDHMAIDLRRGRLFVAELGNGTVDVVDVPAGRVIRRIDGLKEPQGIGYSAAADLVAVASAGDGTVRFYKGDDLTPSGVLALGDDADNVRVDSAGRFVVGYGSGAVAVVDPATRSVLREAKLPAHPEGFQLDGDRAIVNVPDAGQIAVVDLRSGRQSADWRVRGTGSNFPLALDRETRMVATVFRSPPRLVLMDADSGAVRQSMDACGDADDVFLDLKRTRFYVSCGAGNVAVFQGDGAYRHLATVPTASGARTALFVPELDRLFVAERAGLLGGNASILVLRPE